MQTSTRAALAAFDRGYTPIPIITKDKRPHGNWKHLRWESREQVQASFEQWAAQGAGGVGLHLGEPSNGLVDVDLDHPRAHRLRDHFLPKTGMRSGRTGRPLTHYWYQVEGEIPSKRAYKMPDRSVSVELRSDGHQTVIPPSIHPSGEFYQWEGDPWGGEVGPTVVDGKKLAVQVALLGLGSVLLDAWPTQGSRHEAYLALAGGLLRYGDQVHPWWDRNLPVLIGALATATHDEDGAETRIKEVMETTRKRLRAGGEAVGFPKLAELVGADHAEAARRMAREVEQLAWVKPAEERVEMVEDAPLLSTLPPETRNPMEERLSTWEAVDLEPYLSGQVEPQQPSVLTRTDGQSLFYSGRVNSLFGLSEAAKSWIAIEACRQEMSKGERALFVDFEDEPTNTLSRFMLLGAGTEDISNQLRYVHPEDPIATMQRYRFGPKPTDSGKANDEVFQHLLDDYDPTLIVADGMTAIYGMHGHDTNDASNTDVITSWLKSLTRGGRTTVLVIDHTGKNGGSGASPIGAHHKIAMVQGSALRAEAINKPMPGELGKIRLVVYKDRLGAVRAASTKTGAEQVAAVVTLDSRTPGRSVMTIDPADPKDMVLGDGPDGDAVLSSLARAEEQQDQILLAFGGDVDLELSKAELVQQSSLTKAEATNVLRSLMVQGVLSKHPNTGPNVKYRLRH